MARSRSGVIRKLLHGQFNAHFPYVPHTFTIGGPQGSVSVRSRPRVTAARAEKAPRSVPSLGNEPETVLLSIVLRSERTAALLSRLTERILE